MTSRTVDDKKLKAATIWPQKRKRVVDTNAEPNRVIIDPPLEISNDGDKSWRVAGRKYSKITKDEFQKKLTRLLVTPTNTMDLLS